MRIYTNILSKVIQNCERVGATSGMERERGSGKKERERGGGWKKENKKRGTSWWQAAG